MSREITVRNNGLPAPIRAGAMVSAPLYDAPMPQNIEAEMGFLGALMLGGKAAVDKASDKVNAEDFYREADARIYAAILTVRASLEADQELDIVLLKDELIRRGQLDEVGGIGYLMQLADFVPTTANLDYYAQTIARKATLRNLVQGAANVSGLAYSESEDPEVLAEKAAQIMRDASAPLLRRSGVSSTFTKLSQAISEEMDEIEERERQSLENPGGVTGVDTGLFDLNFITGGLQPSDLVVVAGAPGMGKTGLAVCIGRNAAGSALETGKGAVAAFSMEMPRKQLARRILACESGVESHKIRSGLLSKEEWQALEPAYERLWSLPFYIDDRTFLSCDQIRSSLLRLRESEGLSLVVVDYVQIMSPGNRRRFENREAELNEISQGLKNLGREFNVPVLAVAQINRANTRRDDKRPQLFDLHGSSGLEKESDVVAFVYRPSYYERKAEANAAPYHEEAEIIIAKQRNGPVGTVKVRYTPSLTLFSDLPEGEEASPF